MSIVHIYSGSVLLLIYCGVAFKRNRKIHVPIMLSAFTLDMASVLYLELASDVIDKAMNHASQTTLRIHLAFAITTLISYGIALYTGRRLLKNENQIRPIHKINAGIFLVARTVVFITSFFVLPA